MATTMINEKISVLNHENIGDNISQVVSQLTSQTLD